MDYITLEEAKQHLSIDFDDEDGYIQTIIDSAIDYVERQYDLVLDDIYTESGNKMPPSLLHVIKVLISDFYNYRGSMSTERFRPRSVRAIDRLMFIWIKF